ncbi:MAG: hypothetical protein JXR90_10645, partial [Spirochaetes bacterium]|nr:hypothetical protein [Spirochaetota bacterium]
GLINSQIDFIELGFLENCNYDKNRSFYPDITVFDDAFKNIGNEHCRNRITLMLRPDRLNIESIKKTSNLLGSIRIAFYYEHLSLALKYAEVSRLYGYNVYFNPIVITHYSKNNLKTLISEINQFNPAGVSIVDTFGSLTINSIHNIYDAFVLLKEDIQIGLHFHENLLHGFSLIYKFIDLFKEKQIIIDGSMYGMGRAPGNVATENIINCFNDDNKYCLDDIMLLINDIIYPLKSKYKWGYSPEYYISAVYNVHRDYAEYLMKKTSDLILIKKIIREISVCLLGSKYEKSIADKYYEKIVNL